MSVGRQPVVVDVIVFVVLIVVHIKYWPVAIELDVGFCFLNMTCALQVVQICFLVVGCCARSLEC